MAGMDDIVKNLKVETLVGATDVGVTGTNDEWISVGVVGMSSDNRLVVYYDLVINDSSGVSMRVVPRKTRTGDGIPAFDPSMDTWTLGDSSDIKWVQFIADAFLWLDIQVKAAIVGIKPATIAIDYTRVRV